MAFVFLTVCGPGGGAGRIEILEIPMRCVARIEAASSASVLLLCAPGELVRGALD
jgi:hypothetical protein